VLSSLAQFHAISYAIRTDIGEEQFLKKYPCLIEATYLPGKSDSNMPRMFLKPILQNVKDLLASVSLLDFLDRQFDKFESRYFTIKTLQVGDLPNKDFALEILSKYDYKQVYDEIVSIVKSDDGSHFMPLMNHGDIWSNNILFHRDPQTKALDNHVYIDFQVILEAVNDTI